MTPTTIQNFSCKNSVIFSCLSKCSLIGLVTLVALKCLSSTPLHSNFSLTRRSVAILAGVTALTLVAKNIKRILFETSLIHTSRNKLAWWHPINENLVLGAIPLKEHSEALRALGITATLTLLEEFERTSKFIDHQPIGETFAIEAPDFCGVAPEQIEQGVEWLRAKVGEGKKCYVHCKAGRGRSASIVVAYFLRYGIPGNRTPSLQEAIAHVKARRPQINLNSRQRATIIEWQAGHPNPPEK